MTEKQVLMNAYEDASRIRDMKKEYMDRIYDDLSAIVADPNINDFQNMIIALNWWYEDERGRINKEFWEYIKTQLA